MALFRHIAQRQTGSLDLSHWWCDTRLWQWDLVRSAAALVDMVYGLTFTPSIPRLGSQNGVDGSRLCTISFSLCAF